MGGGTCKVRKIKDGEWIVWCTKCSYKEGKTNWTAASSAGWRHRCG